MHVNGLLIMDQMTSTVLVYNTVLDIFGKILYEIHDSDSENIKKSP